MATVNADKVRCVDVDDVPFLLGKFIQISKYCRHLFLLLRFIYAYGNENLFMSDICVIKTNFANEKALEAKHMAEHTITEGGKLHAC